MLEQLLWMVHSLIARVWPWEQLGQLGRSKHRTIWSYWKRKQMNSIMLEWISFKKSRESIPVWSSWFRVDQSKLRTCLPPSTTLNYSLKWPGHCFNSSAQIWMSGCMPSHFILVCLGDWHANSTRQFSLAFFEVSRRICGSQVSVTTSTQCLVPSIRERRLRQ